jgi:hypothetical protein
VRFGEGKSLRKGDVLVIWKLGRLGSTIKHLIGVVDDLTKRGVGFKVLQGALIDTEDSHGKLVFKIFVGLAEFERDVIRERTIAGLAAARARGRKGGRKSSFTPSKLRRAQAALQSRDTSVSGAMYGAGRQQDRTLPEPHARRAEVHRAETPRPRTSIPVLVHLIGSFDWFAPA